MSKLHNVRGRITYISSHTKQENLYAVYETTDRHYWTELARFNQQEFLKSGTEGKCIEARELKNKLFHEALEKEYGIKTVIKAERERNKLEIELSDLKGLARLTKKKELESRISTQRFIPPSMPVVMIKSGFPRCGVLQPPPFKAQKKHLNLYWLKCLYLFAISTIIMLIVFHFILIHLFIDSIHKIIYCFVT